MLIQAIKELSVRQELVSLELADNDTSEITGFFLSASDQLIVMQQIGNDGRSDGFTLFEPELVSELFWGNREHQCIKALAQNKSQITPVLFKSTCFRDAIIELSSRYHRIALFSFDSGDNFEVARIVAHDDEWLKLETSGTLKTLSTLNKLIRIDSICRIEFDTTYLKDIALLYEQIRQGSDTPTL